MKTTIKTTTQYLHMQLFSRRRWRLVSGQVLSCCVYDNPQKCEAHACKHFIHVWPLGRSGCSYAGRELHDLPPSTIEILRSLCHLPAKNLHEQSTFLQNNLLRGARQLTGDEERGGVKSKQIRIAPKFIETNQIKWSFRSNKKVRKLLINLIMQYWVLLAA